HENAEKAMLYLEIQILNKGIAPTIVRGYRVHANLSSGMRIDGINTMIHLGQQLQTDRYTITIRKIVYEERLRRLQMEPKLRDGIAFEFPVPLSQLHRPDTRITLE